MASLARQISQKPFVSSCVLLIPIVELVFHLFVSLFDTIQTFATGMDWTIRLVLLLVAWYEV
jgi:hypothetical protein